MTGLTYNQTQCFHEFEKAALKGQRAPTYLQLLKAGIISPSEATRELTRLGLIMVEVYGQNWRTIFILSGKASDMNTMDCPREGPPYLRFDVNGRHEFEDGELL